VPKKLSPNIEHTKAKDTQFGKRAHRPYSSEAFVDVIVKFIVADDQVRVT